MYTYKYIHIYVYITGRSLELCTSLVWGVRAGVWGKSKWVQCRSVEQVLWGMSVLQCVAMCCNVLLVYDGSQSECSAALSSKCFEVWTCCSVLQRVAACCQCLRVLKMSAVLFLRASSLRYEYVAVCLSVLQSVVGVCGMFKWQHCRSVVQVLWSMKVLQCVVVYCSILHVCCWCVREVKVSALPFRQASALRCECVHLQHIVNHCNTVQHTATCCNTLQHMQHTAAIATQCSRPWCTSR